ncbi:polymer-forming cytoskeletal protein [Marivirga atlantica]|jgi:cytoskeletal protein CcmA (bactofilin family)|uniref:Polymer-forming cytoskeletal protein n=1 Tax=Marivirga atlantica TaxID=1548457 RepID=A0A937DG16_9BACT|nr:polymer-forming cytoskeletal protein [Marivirga atlantica]MBL0764298.1 polymer-forming cytoskeletal protein [Marivirga atlantica]
MFNNKQEKNQMAQDVTSSSNTVGKGTVINGDLETFGNIRIDGKVIGNIKTKSKLVLGATSHIDGNVLAQNAEIEGEVKGVVEITELLVLKPSAVLHGDIITNKLIVESGATFNGACKMGVATKSIKIGEEASNGQATSKLKEAKPV